MADIAVSMTSPNGVTLATKGTYCPENVKVTPTLQTKPVTPGDTAQTVTPDSGFCGLASVQVGAIPNDYLKYDKHWVVTITSIYADVLITDTWLAEHRSDDNLMIMVIPRASVTSGSYFQGLVAFNDPFLPSTNHGNYLYFRHSTSNKAFQYLRGSGRLDDDDAAGYRMIINSDGSLRDKSGYHIAPTTFDVFAKLL